MADRTSSTLRRRELGHRLRHLRQRMELTLDQVAAQLLCSTSKISRIESGARRATQRDVRDLCALYGVGGADLERLMELTRESRERGWWEDVDLPHSTYIGLEQSALAISEYSASVVPGLLQTESYAVALTEGMEPKLDPALVRQRWETKKARQAILAGPDAPHLWAVVDEAALGRTVGSPAVMSDQLHALIESARSPRIHLQVMPLDVGAHPGLNSNFIIVELGRPDVPDVIYVEGLLGNFYLERAADLERYRQVFDQLRAIALSPRLSVEKLRGLKHEHDRNRQPGDNGHPDR